MDAHQFSFKPLELFGTTRMGSTTADIDIEVSRWLETHHPIEIFDKRMPYPSNFYLSSDVPKKYGTLREVLNSLPNMFSYSNVMQRYADLLAENQPVSVEPITFFIKCLEEKKILEYGGLDAAGDQIRNARDAGEMIEILSNCKQPGINQVMSDYIDYLQTKFIKFMMNYTDYSRFSSKFVLQCNFRYLVIPFLEELTILNRNPKGHDFIRSKLTIVRLGRDRMTDFPVLVNFIWGEGSKGGPNEKIYNQTRKLLMDKHREPAEAARAGIEDILTRVDRDVAARAHDLGHDVSDELSQPRLNDPGSEDRKQFARRSRGGKRTKKRKQKRSTNKKRRIHKKRGRMSKRR
jgi:hypothetical protein